MCRTGSGAAADLNASTGNEVFLCMRRGFGPPITDLGLIFPKKGETVPNYYTKIYTTTMQYRADLNSGNGGTP